jgi:hypothetical protein
VLAPHHRQEWTDPAISWHELGNRLAVNKGVVLGGGDLEQSFLEEAPTIQTEAVLAGDGERVTPGAVRGRWWKYLIIAGQVAALIALEWTRGQQAPLAVGAAAVLPAQAAAPTAPAAPVSPPEIAPPLEAPPVTASSKPVAGKRAKERHHKRRAHPRRARPRAAR